MSGLIKTVITAAGVAFVSLSLCGSAVLAKAQAPKAPAAKTPANLHRLDFRIEGASCAACLMRMGHEFRDVKGVIKADVSIYKPYWAIVIYDAQQTNIDKMKEAIKSEHVKLEQVEDKSIPHVPLIVIPKASGTPGADGHQFIPEGAASH